jgi:hypothetical protein
MIASVLVSVWPADALSLSGGISAGVSYLHPEEWGHGYYLAGRLSGQEGEHLQYGIAGTVELWLPVSETPSGKVGASWESAGSAWLFELGPIIRVFTDRPEEGKFCLFFQGGAGVAAVSSDAEIIVYPVVPDAIGIPREIIGSQTAPYFEIGGGIPVPFKELIGEFMIMSRTVFTDPETAISTSFSVGLNF